ncbi:MAG: hypothetical protein MZV64_14380 [Ignavibacteriales bacterium]|nr:hypothetical protein [Ignavibacteriales bacterium]
MRKSPFVRNVPVQAAGRGRAEDRRPARGVLLRDRAQAAGNGRAAPARRLRQRQHRLRPGGQGLSQRRRLRLLLCADVLRAFPVRARRRTDLPAGNAQGARAL